MNILTTKFKSIVILDKNINIYYSKSNAGQQNAPFSKYLPETIESD